MGSSSLESGRVRKKQKREINKWLAKLSKRRISLTLDVLPNIYISACSRR